MSWWDDLIDWINRVTIQAIADIMALFFKIKKMVDDFIQLAQIFLYLIDKAFFRAIDNIAKAVSDGLSWIKRQIDIGIVLLKAMISKQIKNINNFLTIAVATINIVTNDSMIRLRDYTTNIIIPISLKLEQVRQFIEDVLRAIYEIEKSIAELIKDPTDWVKLLFKGLEMMWGDIDTGEPKEEEL